MNKEYHDILDNAVRIARLAGEEHLKLFRTPGLAVNPKFNESDIVTAADKAAERVILGEIARLYPGHEILSEESGEIKATSGSGYRWIIDPLDGTTNFSAGLPYFSVSIAVEIDSRVVVGVVFAPRLGEMFTAVAGEGAWLNGTPIAVRANKMVERAVVATGFPVDKNICHETDNLDNVARVLPLVRGLRRLGSAALDLSYVGAGFLDAYWENNLHLWDVAAGLLIATEAGAMSASYRSDRNYSLLAATPAVFETLRPLIR